MVIRALFGSAFVREKIEVFWDGKKKKQKKKSWGQFLVLRLQGKARGLFHNSSHFSLKSILNAHSCDKYTFIDNYENILIEVERLITGSMSYILLYIKIGFELDL